MINLKTKAMRILDKAGISYKIYYKKLVAQGTFVIQPVTANEVIADVGKTKPEYEQIYVYKDIIFWSAPL